MRIALSGVKPSVHKEIIKNVQSLWPTYVSPVQTIFDEDTDNQKLEESANQSVKDVLADLNVFEKDNFLAWNLLYSQYEKYNTQKHIIYNGSPIDLFVFAMAMKALDKVGDEYIEKCIYYLKKYLRKLDVVYWVPNVSGFEDLDEFDLILEKLYNGIYNNYHDNFSSSPYFDQEYCPAFIRFDSTDYIEEMKLILDRKGDLEGDNVSGGATHSLEEQVKVQKMFRGNKEALDAIQAGLEAREKGNVEIQ